MTNKEFESKIVDSLLKSTEAKFSKSMFAKHYNKVDDIWIIYTTDLDLYASKEFEDYIESIIDDEYNKVCFLHSEVSTLEEEKIKVNIMWRGLEPVKNSKSSLKYYDFDMID